MNAKTRAAGGELVDLRIFLLVHRALRHDFGALAQAIGRGDGPAGRDRALDRCGRATLWRLEHHHHGEDARVWPLLRAKAPEAAAVLDALEAEHQHLDRLVADARAALEVTRAP